MYTQKKNDFESRYRIRSEVERHVASPQILLQLVREDRQYSWHVPVILWIKSLSRGFQILKTGTHEHTASEEGMMRRTKAKSPIGGGAMS